MSETAEVTALRKDLELAHKHLAEAKEMIRIFTVSLHTVHDKDPLNGGARMMLASMGRATLEKMQDYE